MLLRFMIIGLMVIAIANGTNVGAVLLVGAGVLILMAIAGPKTQRSSRGGSYSSGTYYPSPSYEPQPTISLSNRQLYSDRQAAYDRGETPRF